MLVASPLDWLVTVILAAPGALLLVVFASMVWRGHDAELTPGNVYPLRIPPWVGLLRWTAVGYLVLMIWITVGLKWTGDPAKEALRGFEAATNLLAVSAMVLLVLLGYACRKLRWTQHGVTFFEAPKPFRPMFRGYATLVVAAFAVTLASGFSGGLAFWTANLIGKPMPDGTNGSVPACGCAESVIRLSSSYWTGALLWGVLAIVAVLGLFWVIWRRKREWRDDGVPAVVDRDYSPGEPKPRTLGKIVLQWRLALTKYRYHWALGLLSLLGGVLVLAAGVIAFIRLLPWWQRKPPGWVTWVLDRTELVSGLGAWVVSGLLGGLLFVGLRSWQGQKMRTAVGVVWDLIAFWPRLAHPICPPPYGGRTALLLQKRIKVLEGTTIVLSGHSQGSVVCTAVVRLLDDETLKRVRLVTYGSQLQWAFARLFPTYMGHAEMVAMHGELGGRWRSIYRWTDPLGGPVLTWPESEAEPHPTVPLSAGFGTDIRLIDPVTVGGDEATQPRSELRGHSGYYLDPAFDVVVADLAE